MICKNEEAVIDRALQSLTWADEIIIVDGFSVDRTVEIAQKYTSQIHMREWTNFGEQRNFALTKCTHPWVFFLDADEVCSPKLIAWMEKFKKGGPENVVKSVSPSPSDHPVSSAGKPTIGRVDLYEIRRLEHFLGIRYRYGAGNPSHQWRFFRKDGAKFVGDVHEYVVVEGKIMRLEASILHFPKTTLTDMVTKMNRYSTYEAEKLFQKGVVRSSSYMFFSGVAMFLKSFFRKQGFRDGVLGFVLAVMEGSGFFLRQAKLYMKNREAGRIGRIRGGRSGLTQGPNHTS